MTAVYSGRPSVALLQPRHTWAVVVARVGPRAKSRLAAQVPTDERTALALAMLRTVSSVCAAAGLAGVIGVVDTPAACRLVTDAGGLALLDAEASEMNAAAMRGIRLALGKGAQAVLVLPGDVPLVSVADLHALIGAVGAQERAVVVGCSRDGQGTNALLLRPADLMAPSFGPPSVERHLQLGQAAGAATHLLRGLDLALDVDTPADLAELRQRTSTPLAATPTQP